MVQLSVLGTEVTVCGPTEMAVPAVGGPPLPPAASSFQPASPEHILLSLTSAQDGGMDFPSVLVARKLPMFFLWKYIFAITILY